MMDAQPILLPHLATLPHPTTAPVSQEVTRIDGIPDFKNTYTEKCTLCKELLLDPFQTKCGHRLCRQCVVNHLAENGDPTLCPFAEEDCEKISLKLNDGSVYPDFYLLKQLKKKEVYCTFKHLGCPEIMQLGKLNDHVQRCDYGKVPCPNAALGCPDKLQNEELDKHVKQCDFRPTECRHCHEMIPASQMSGHLHICPMMKIACPYSCGERDILRGKLYVHQEVCPLKPVTCTYKEMGCKFEGSAEKVASHEETEMAEHLMVLRLYCEKLGTKLKDMERQQEEKRDASSTSLEEVREDVRKHDQKLNRQEMRIRETQKTIANQAQSFIERQTLQSGATSLQLESRQETANLNSHITRIDGMISRMDEKFSTQAAKFSEFDLRFQVIETASYNGVLIWKIKDYMRRKEDAKNGGILSLYSQAFYTSRHGYRMCARVYLNGDGMGVGSHLSLFFVVMRGEYDPLLKWPFCQKVSLMLLDQVGQMRHIRDTFRPDPSSSSFQQPRTDMNIASGCPLFVSHAVLEAKDSLYLRDDTIFIKIVCELDGISSGH